MSRARLALVLAVLLLAARPLPSSGAEIPLNERRSAYDDMSRDNKAMQDDDTSNPGMLAVLDGEALWSTKAGASAKSCADCHGQGQLNLSCGQCHDDNWGKHLAGNTVPQAHPTGYPIYRLEWQSLGSLQRRLRNCMIGMRAESYAYGAPEYVDMELYLMWRARGMKMETPAVRP